MNQAMKDDIGDVRRALAKSGSRKAFDRLVDALERAGEHRCCTCYDDGVMCVTPRDCPEHGATRSSEVGK